MMVNDGKVCAAGLMVFGVSSSANTWLNAAILMTSHTTHFFKFTFHLLNNSTEQRNGVEFKTGDAQHAVEHMAHQLVLTSTTKVYDSYNLQRLAMTLHVHYDTAWKKRVTVNNTLWV